MWRPGEGIFSMRLGLVRNFAWAGCLAAAAAFAPSSQAASITAQLDCNLNVLKDTGSCDGTSFGTVKIDDSIGGGMVTLTVTLGSGLKFKDMVLAFGGSATSIWDTNDAANTVVLNEDSFTIGPNGSIGFFDIGDETTQNGWDGDSGYSVILDGNQDLALIDFLNAFDTTTKLSVALHIQSIGPDECNTPSTCIPGTVGGGSLFQGGTFKRDGDIPDVPEPSTILLMGGALLGLGLLKKKRNS